MKKEQKLIKRDLQEAQYIGEDGGMVVDGRFSALGAWRKMIKRLREDCGEEEVTDFKQAVTPDELGRGWLHLVNPENQDKFESDTEWYVSIKDESPYEVWTYWG